MAIHPTSTFQVLSDTRPHDHSLNAFMVSTTRGFLPRDDPVIKLPTEFDALESILCRMPIKTLDGSPGLLAKCKLGLTVLEELPDLTDAIEMYQNDLPLMNALYRDYSFLASAYLLEPCMFYPHPISGWTDEESIGHERYLKGEPYGLARSSLPRSIAVPIVKVADMYGCWLATVLSFRWHVMFSAGFKPFMEYAGSYALFNYRLEDPEKGLEYSNLRLIRAFEHGLDPSSSEAGFVLVHIAMVRQSGGLVSGALRSLDACSSRNREKFNVGLSEVASSLKKVNAVMNGEFFLSSFERHLMFL
jgi:indoleamine 2,3-dioxygenase